ncbi:MAG: coenzyme F420-reducing hydrogenase, FrhD protein [Methanobrevibacter sp.]|uniref:coenzyme F420-reducing hydrogenase, FrhD protein n=1 Tax=Methanobrevibacter sp. TaxID=66852 RepID=UPI0025F096DA|nr:coenzyme F420-reducing hydrogenase, FrhD protein [Methanobrevibacter sp.]MBR0271454.1 coenzyme F420-reducing hydrogenase, FrhD protein [Methanobrevibacter sp.]
MPYNSDIIVVGCGNILFKDDGFGPILINILQKYFDDKKDYYDPAVTSYVEDEFDKDILSQIQEKFEGIKLPDNVQFIDGGTAAPTNFFPLYDQYDWKKLIVLDVVEFQAEPGTVDVFDPKVMQAGKYDNPHGMTVEEPLQKISEKCEVVIVGCKPAEIPTPDIDMGLTEPVAKAIPKAIDIILNEIGVK